MFHKSDSTGSQGVAHRLVPVQRGDMAFTGWKYSPRFVQCYGTVTRHAPFPIGSTQWRVRYQHAKVMNAPNSHTDHPPRIESVVGAERLCVTPCDTCGTRCGAKPVWISRGPIHKVLASDGKGKHSEGKKNSASAEAHGCFL